jgi:TolB-like protein/class 3 adenylate cyclase/AraC-like DNA-binding protein/Tfp pilus assembly protein PilF
MKHQNKRRLAAIMFTDIVGYSALMQRDESAAADIRLKHRQAFEAQHEIYEGEILQYFGDGTLSVFQSGVAAVECAIAIQKGLKGGAEVPVRIGLHLGDIVFDGTDIYGDSVNVASRIESMSIAGAILLSGRLNEELKNQLQISTLSLGQFDLKNIETPVEIYAVSNEGITIPALAELKGGRVKKEKTIAVLPFVNRSKDPDNEYFSDGMTEEVINALTNIKGLKVTSRTSSFFFKNKNLPIAEIGRALKVSIILEGSIRLVGNKMRLAAQLIDVAEDYHFWSETFDRSIDDIFEVQDEISLLIAERLREHIGHFEIADRLVNVSEISIDGYKSYLKGRYHLLKMTKPDLDKGIAILEEVLRLQPRFALAHLGLNLGYTLMGTLGFVPAAEAFIKGKPYLEKAIELDENLPECQLHLSYISFLQKWDIAETYTYINRALEIRPTVEGYQSMASTLVAERKIKAAFNYVNIALQIDPFSAINNHLKGFIFYIDEQYEEAIKWFEKTVELKDDFSISTPYWGQALILAGKKKAALNFFKNLAIEEDRELIQLGGMTLAYAALGNKKEAAKGIKALEKALETDLVSRAMNVLILANALLGDHEKALAFLEKGIAHRLPLIIYLFTDPILKPLRNYEKFKNLMQKVLGGETNIPFVKRKYKKALFDEKLLKAYKTKLSALMADEKPYLDANLTLRSLAERLDISSNYLSQLLNEGFNKNFSEYVNTFRLDAFKAKVASPKHRHLTILALAYESGFNSKTVFNTFFKKMMGKTPRTYWKETIAEMN